MQGKMSEKIPFIRRPLENGWYVTFTDYLQLSLRRLIHAGQELESPIEVKISGDRAPFYRSASFILLSFSFPLPDPRSQSSSAIGNET